MLKKFLFNKKSIGDIKLNISNDSSWENNTAAKMNAQKLAFAPFAFQAAKVSRDTGILTYIEKNNGQGVELEKIAEYIKLSIYSIKILLDICISIDIVEKRDNKYFLTKTGYFLINDTITKINMDFVNDVCYLGMYHLEEAIKENKPAGLKVLGNWKTLYEGLSQFPEKAKKSWLNFDHFYSDRVFPKMLHIVFKDNPKKILDVGGNTGKWAIECAKFSKDAHITIMDLPGQLKQAKKNISQYEFNDRISYYSADILDKKSKFPEDNEVIWMSQFLDCFAEDEITNILLKALPVMKENTKLYILETFTDRQKFEEAKFCLEMTSLYFTCMANGNSKMYNSNDMISCIEKAGLTVTEDLPVGISHTLFICKKQ
ncbi:MAG: class I SAM-dependent methyltransferase [Spirochaetes bacterium]|nr:class I SAM-dependent methyltransferase [Spirochaetota bacterium]